MSLQTYSGEFTISPIPLELSMNYCSHKCAYCFANLNQPGRTFDAKGTIDKIRNSGKSKSLTAHLLNNKYPILLSNRVDPFAQSNYKQAIPLIEILQKNGNPISFQTKGGNGIDDAIQIVDKSHWYISISFSNDELRKKIEPGATTITQRFELIRKLKENGHSVSIGLNPVIEDWLPLSDYEELIKIFKELGIKDIWCETLHLNPKQIKNLSDKEFINIGESVINEAKKRHTKIFDSYYQYLVEDMFENGFNVFSMGQPFKSSYFNNSHEIYKGKTLKTTQDFINHCFDNYEDGQEIRFSDYYQFMKSDFYEMSFSEVDGYAYRIARNVYKRNIEKPFKRLKDVLFWYWDNIDVSKSLFNNPLFSVVSYEENKKIIPYLCKDNGTLIYKFNKSIPANKFFIT